VTGPGKPERLSSASHDAFGSELSKPDADDVKVVVPLPVATDTDLTSAADVPGRVIVRIVVLAIEFATV
jgi:hypothetical protein